MKRLLITALLLAFSAGWCRADEGMWLPSLISSRIKDMKSKGFRLKAEDLYDVNNASYKDAIVKFGNGCTGELISAEGLLLTNHHCGYGAIQKLSSVQNDYLTNGFWAMNRGEELPNQGLSVTFLVRMDEVTDQVLEGVTPAMDAQKRAKTISDNCIKLIKQTSEKTGYNVEIEPFYYGNQYFLFQYEIFEDVRLVGAPPSSIGNFGGDTDNWMWPRHTGDFSLFRIYAGPDNKPAKYSPDNVPYRPKKHFTVSTKGVKEGDFTFIYGLPARTSEYITADAVDYILNRSNPVKIELRTIRLNEIKRASEADRAVRIQYAAKKAGIANAWKKWQGESLGLSRLQTVERKRTEEAAFQKWADALPESHPYAQDYRQVLPRLHTLYTDLNDYALARDYYAETYGGVELLRFAELLYANVNKSDVLVKFVEAFYKDYSPLIDRQTAALILQKYIDGVPKRFVPELFTTQVEKAGSVKTVINELFEKSSLTTIEGCNVQNKERMVAICDIKSVTADPAIRLAAAFSEIFKDRIMPRYNTLNDSITILYTTYMRGLMEQQPRRDFYPDANFTLRLSYGKVAGYRPADGVIHLYQTTLDGAIAKDDPSVYDYNVPQRLRELYAAKDYGRWAENGTVPIAFIATNHTSGGNSGSPVLNGRGELVGLNFDRTWLSTMSDLQFDPTMCRNISVDIRYVMFVIEKVGGAGYLLDEITFSK